MTRKRPPHPRHSRKPKPAPEPWPPLWARLPDTIEDIEAGRRLAPMPTELDQSERQTTFFDTSEEYR